MSQTEVQLIKNGAVVDADINGMSSSKLSGALPAISGASLTNLPIPTGKTRNLIINGAMRVAQRGTSSTTSGIHTVDRIGCDFGGADENPTQEQVDVAAGTTPYSLGFRKAFKITNGNQTSGAGASDYVRTDYKIEAQDVAGSGWNYTSSSSNITLSFWVKSSVSKDFNFLIHTTDGTAKLYPMTTGTLSADTWTKITKTIPGVSTLTFDNNNGSGIIFQIYQYLGTTYTANSVTNNQWQNYSSTEQTPDQTSTWWTTNNATFELTGVQLEVGDSATDFEHRSFGDELLKCQRYYFKETATYYAGMGYGTNANSNCLGVLQQPCVMRATPTATLGSADFWGTGPSGGGQSASYSYVYGSTSVANGPRIQGYELSAEL